jgi:hypothetical protein
MARPAPSLVLLSLFALACTPAEDDADSSAPAGAGGKADGFGTCGDDRVCLDARAYEVLFTNPVCGLYEHEPVEAVRGDTEIDRKPRNVWCTPKFDSAPSKSRSSSPQFRILEWLADAGEGDEVFAASLSFSDADVGAALCGAAERGAKVTFVLDKMTSQGEALQACGGEVLVRGHQGSIGFAHVKLLMINPREPAGGDDGFVKLTFGSGNMSSGTHLHHENWHFIDARRDSFFVAAHTCLMDALVDERHTDGKTAFRTFMNECRDAIEHPPEEDIVPFFIPVREDSKAATAKLVELIGAADEIDIGAHRFSFRAMIDALAGRLADTERPFQLRFVADDDLYWLDPLEPSKVIEGLGPNDRGDRDKLRQLRAADKGKRFEERYFETNHVSRLLHHNKYLVFRGVEGGNDAVIVGSPNLTGTGFDENLENLYLIEIPEVVEAFHAQYELVWNGEGPLPEGLEEAPRATPREAMPLTMITVDEPSEALPEDPDAPPPSED